VHVPETAVHEDRDTVSRKDDVWRSWQIAPVQPETVAHGEQSASHDHFRFGIFASNPGHHPASDLPGDNIRHCTTSANFGNVAGGWRT
jgi:hypothetical protein